MAKRKQVKETVGELVATALRPMRGSFSYSSCRVYCSFPTTCPLCRVHVPANTPHECSSEKPESK